MIIQSLQMQKSNKQKEQEGQICVVDLEEFTEKSHGATVKVVGTIKTIFKHQKYILEIYLYKKLAIRCYKRYNDFEALYELMKMKYKNQDLGEFPSKFQIFNKEETRKLYFQKFITSLLKNHDSNRRLISIVYLFLSKGIKQSSSRSSDHQNREDFLKSQLGLEEETRTEAPQRRDATIGIKSQKAHKYSYQQPTNSPVERKPTSMDGETSSLYPLKKKILNQYQIKIQHEGDWKKRFIKIQGSCLLLFKNKLDNNFRTKIELFRIRAQYLKRNMNLLEHFCFKMEFKIEPVFKENKNILSLYHEYDQQKILIRKTQGQNQQFKYEQLEKLRQQINLASHIAPSTQYFEGVFNPIGKLFIILNKLNLSWLIKDESEQTITVKIKTSAFQYYSKKMLYRQQIHMKQAFLIPISNTFEKIIFQVILVKDQGWIRQQQQQKIVASYCLPMSELLTRPNAHLKLSVDMQSKIENYKTQLFFSVENLSHFSSIYSDSFLNENDGKVLRGLKLDDASELGITLDRVLRIFGYVALFIQAFWRNIYLFKYPRMGFTFFSVLLFSLMFLDINQGLTMLVMIILLAVLYQHQKINRFANMLLDQYVFILHKQFRNPQILSTSQVTFLKWSNHLKYIGQDYHIGVSDNQPDKIEKKKDKKRLIFQFKRHGKTFLVRQEEQSIFEKMMQVKKILELVHKIINTIVNSVQKVTSLLTWVDFRRTCFLLFLLFLLTGIASIILIKGILTLLCIHRLVKGRDFYRQKHYRNNRSFAIHSLRYILNKSFPQLLPKDKDLKNLSTQEIGFFLSQIVFPIHDQSSQKKLKQQMDDIVNVYLDTQSLCEIYGKKNNLKIGNLISMIQTCQSRLKLKWIPGKQGISNEFQQLKEKTKQIPVMDVWLESTVMNLVLNTPSKLYTTLYPDKHQEKLL